MAQKRAPAEQFCADCGTETSEPGRAVEVRIICGAGAAHADLVGGADPQAANQERLIAVAPTRGDAALVQVGVELLKRVEAAAM
ncbi:hypothetical protein LLG90_13605 [Aromatoleum toluclasticum]|uniref:hypothetical protein n=1 Tax=Aromatoleum toluclasticum TaxID=92003 RepID=UPI001D189C37|nr:hypothetical protein [Aromatoleum toluclasticum]MCC4116391.1 hypothetical protein [Aromatoleum toluclasticum]